MGHTADRVHVPQHGDSQGSFTVSNKTKLATLLMTA